MRKLSDKQWEILEPWLPRQDFSRGGRPRIDNRQVFEAIRWVLTTGAQWNEVPAKYGSGKTAWKRFRQWKQQGVWKKIWQQLLVMLDKQEKLTWEVSYLDGTFASAKKGEQKLTKPSEEKGQK
jgi:transposase